MTRSEQISQVWAGLKALLNAKPDMAAYLKEHPNQISTQIYFLICLDYAEHNSINAAARANQISRSPIETMLARLYNFTLFKSSLNKWLTEHPELLPSLIKDIGVHAWPNVQGAINQLDINKPEILKQLGVSPEIALIILVRFQDLEVTIIDAYNKIDQLERRLKVVSEVTRSAFSTERLRQAEIAVGLGFDIPEKSDVTERTTRIEELDFSVRTYNCLKKANIETVEDFIGVTEEDLLNLRFFGDKSLIEVKDKLSDFGITLASHRDVNPSDFDDLYEEDE